MPESKDRLIAKGVTVDPEHWQVFRLLYPNASERVRALVLLDLRRARKKGKLDALIALHGDDTPGLEELIQRLP